MHKYHRFFLPILFKLYEEQKNDCLIDITDCLKGTDFQNAAIVKNLNLSEFAVVKKEIIANVLDSKHKPAKFFATILPLGVDYLENFIEEYKKATKNIPPVGFRTNH